MKIRSLALENFRQFYGRQSLSFSDDTERNVTIVYAANGAGKTTLLNAFTWGLYERFTPDFENPEELVNDRAWAEAAEGADVEARATVVFDHENRVYTLDRVSSYRKAANGKRQLIRDAEISLRVIDEDGRDSSAQNPRDSLSQMLPERLHQFFFFNGERIENLVKPAAYAEIEAAIKTVLGLEIIERSVRHLKDAKKKLELELRLAGSPEDERLHDELEQARKNVETKEASLSSARDNRAALQTDLEAVDDKMRTLEEARALQEKRDQVESDLETNRQSIGNQRKQLAATINSTGYLAFTETLASRCLEALKDRRSKGEIPTPIKRQFVEDLLERGECICGTSLSEGEKAWAHVAEWRERAGSHEVEEAWNQLSAQAGFFLDTRTDLYRELRDKDEQLVRLRAAQRGLQEQASEIHRQLGQKDSEEIKSLEGRRDTLRRKIDDLNINIGGIGNDLEQLAKLEREKEKDLESAKAASEKAKLAQRRVKTASEAREIFARILAMRTDDVRQELDSRIKSIYTRISFKPYVPVLTEQFRLELRKSGAPDSELVAKSTGENQVLSLAFVGAVAELARDRYEELESQPPTGANVLSFKGGIYPIVIDSAFGTLDENYREHVAERLPNLAPQVAAFVSKAQGLGIVADRLAPKVGRRYVITFHTTKKDATEETVTLAGQELPYVVRSTDGHDWAVLTEVE